MKNTIAKVFGLPHSSVKVLNQLLQSNFDIVKNTTIHNVDFLGWDHAAPKNREVYEVVEEIKDCKMFFFFCLVDYEMWLASLTGKNNYFYNNYIETKEKKLIVYSPEGPEAFDSYKCFYDSRVESYLRFYLKNPDISFLIDCKDLSNNQSTLFEVIKNKFSLSVKNKFTEIGI